MDIFAEKLNLRNMKSIVEIQRKYYGTGATRPIRYRIDKLKLLRQKIREFEEQIEFALGKDLHKSAYESYLTEISLVLRELDLYIHKLRRWTRPEIVRTPLQFLGAKSRIIYEPFGVVLIIAPWNYPFQLLLMPLIGAIAAGNCVVLKTSPKAAEVNLVMRKIIAETFQTEEVTFVEGKEEIKRMLEEERFDYVFFTGSPGVGKKVMAAAAKHLTPMTLELGGKSPVIVSKYADIDLAARRIVWGKCLNAGQTCIAPDYLLVHDEVKKALLQSMEYYRQKFYGDCLKKSEDYPRMIDREATERMRMLMQKGNILYGGEVDEMQQYVAFTILDGVSPEDPLMQQEIFGPILPVLEFRQEQEAVDYINSCEKPLALYYFGKPEDARKIITCTSSGGVCVNDTVMHIANPYLPFGGVGNSGMGRYHGYETFLTFSNRRAVFYATTWWEIPFRFPPYKHLSVLKKFMG